MHLSQLCFKFDCDVDSLYKQWVGFLKNRFVKVTSFYQILSPDHLGITQGSEVIMPQGIIEFQYPPKIGNSDAIELLSNLTVSLSIFMLIFNKCYVLLCKNEEMPILER